MHIGQWIRDTKVGWRLLGTKGKLKGPQLILVFGSRQNLKDAIVYQNLRQMFTNGTIVMCSTSGEISGSEICTDSVQVTSIEFSNSHIEVSDINISEVKGSIELNLGEIWIESELDQGAIFYFTWPKIESPKCNAQIEEYDDYVV